MHCIYVSMEVYLYCRISTSRYLLCSRVGPPGKHALSFFRLVAFVCSYLPHSLRCLPHTLPGEWLNQCMPVHNPTRLTYTHTHTNNHAVTWTDTHLHTVTQYRPKYPDTYIYLHLWQAFEHKFSNIYSVLNMVCHKITFSLRVTLKTGRSCCMHCSLCLCVIKHKVL